MVKERRLVKAALLAACLSVAATAIPVPALAQDAGSGALFNAIRDNDLDAVKQIVASGADPRARDENGVSAPQAAVRLGHHVIAHFLLAYRRPKTEVPQDDAIDRALDRAVAETEQTTGPIPDAAPPPETVDNPVTLPEPVAMAPLAPPPAVEIPVIDAFAPETPAPEAPTKLAEAPAAEATPAAPLPTPLPEPIAPKAKRSLMERATGWLGGLFGFDDDKDDKEPAPSPAVVADSAKTAQPAPADRTAPSGNVPIDQSTGAISDLDRMAAQDNPALETAKPDLPEADLPKALAGKPASNDPLADVLALPDGGTDPLPDGGVDPLLSMLDDAGAKTSNPTTAPNKAEAEKLDLTKMAPKERLAWLDKLLAQPVNRDAQEALDDGKDVALSHLRERARRKAEEIAAAQAALSEQEKKNLKTNTASVEGPPPGTNLSRRLKIPLPPPNPEGRKNFARDPWFRDVSPDEPEIRAAHRELRAGPPERGAPAPSIPKVPQLTNLPKGEDAKLAQGLPPPPPIRETARPAAATTPSPAAPATPGGGTLDALEKEFGGATTPATSPLGNDPLAAELGLDAPAEKNPAATAAATDPLAAELGLDALAEAKPAPASKDPLAAELDLGTPADDAEPKKAENDPLGGALGDALSELTGLVGDKKAAPAIPETPTATPTEILSALPAGSEVKLDAEGRPVLPAAWTLPVVLPGQAPPVQDLASAYITPASFRSGFNDQSAIKQLGPLPPGANGPGAWPVTKIQMADGKVVPPPVDPNQANGDGPRLASAQPGKPLEGVTLSLGSGTSLYNTFVPEDAMGGDGRAPECVSKANGRTMVCIKDLNWPAFLEPKFLVSTILYTGTASVVRFDDGAPTRMHVVFAADAFNEITDWLVRRFGPPTATVTRSVAPFGQSRRENPTMIWRAVDRVTQKDVSLEIRHYDDTRDGFPDIRNGVIMLYREGAPSIFPQISVHELMRLKRTG